MKPKLLTFILIFLIVLIPTLLFGVENNNSWFIKDKTGYITIIGVIDKEMYNNVLFGIVKFSNNSDIDNIKIIINSSGGHFYYALSISQLLKSLNDKIVIETYGTGIVASAATLILMNGTKNYRFLYDDTLLMMHLLRFGNDNINNQDPASKIFNTLEYIESVYENFYLKTLNIDEETLKEMLLEESWFLPEKALQIGLSDKIIIKEK